MLARRFAKWGAGLGLACGVVYALGGLVIDLRTTGLNWGSLLAFGALIGMPALAAAVGFVLGPLIGFSVQGVRTLFDRSDDP